MTCTWTNIDPAVSRPVGVTVFAGDGNDKVDMARSSVPARIWGEGGFDYLIGGDGPDVLFGQDGDDYLQGACGVDSYSGGAGSDAVTFNNESAACFAHATGVTASLDGVANDPDGENIGGGSEAQGNLENIHGTDFADVLTAGSSGALIYANGGDDAVNHRNGVADVIDCGAGTDTSNADLAGTDASITGCETVNREALPMPPGPKPPTKYTDIGGCPSGQKTMEVGGIKVCYKTEKKLSATKYELAGDVNLAGFMFFSGSAPLVIDTTAKAASISGTTTVSIKYGSTRYDVFQSVGTLGFNLSAKTFTLNATSASPLMEIAKVKVGLLLQNGYVQNALTQAAKFNVDLSTRALTYKGGATMLGGALTVTGDVGYSADNGPVVELKGCIAGSLPIGNNSQIAAINNACVSYNRSSNTWAFGGQAVLFNSVKAKAGASLLNGGLESFGAQLTGAGRLPVAFGAYLDGGGISVGGIKSGNLTFQGNVHGGWPVVPTGVADLTIEGAMSYDVNNRMLRISGNGSLKSGNVEVANGSLSLALGFGGNFAPSTFEAQANVNALGGFITGGLNTSIDNTGFYGSGFMTVGFPADSEVTRNVNSALENTLHCNYFRLPWVGNINWCPYVTGRSITAEAAVSSKGVGAKTNWDKLYATVWWASSTRQFNTNFGWGDSTALSSVIGKSRSGADIVSATATQKWVIPKDARLASLQLSGSPTGDLKVTDPNGRVVFDTATQTAVDGIGFGRDPLGAGQAAFGLFAPALKPGTWTVSIAGAAPFTKVGSLLSVPPKTSEVTKVTPIGRGVKPTTRTLVAGASQLRIGYTSPAGTKATLRASSADGKHSIVIAAGLKGTGTRTWRVDKGWAGTLRINAVTEHDGVPLEQAKHSAVFRVTHPKLAPV
ncbi:MAG: hypothetical protein JWN72_398, partial [Thermoleophilia bacterium]|nr:hypothetical protein [Thermoleophilia bacterium]